MRLTPKTEASDFGNEHAWLAGQNHRAWSITLDADLFRADANNDKIVKSGTVLAKVSATGLYGPVKKTTLAANALSTDTTITVDDAMFFQAGDAIDINGTAATISSINYDTNVITLTGQIGAAKTTGDTVKATDGTGTAVCVLFNSVNLKDGDQAEAAVFEGALYEARLTNINDLIKADLATKFHFREF